MQIRVRFFAILRDRTGLAETRMTLDAPATIASAVRAIAEQFPSISDFLPRVAAAVNQEYASADSPLRDGDELALIPPVSGGTS